MTLTRTRTRETVWPEEWTKTSKKQTNLVVRRTEMFSDHRVASKVVRAQHALMFCEPARMRVAFSATVGVLCGLALLLIKETVFFLSVCRQASQQGHLGNKCICPMLDCSEQDPALGLLTWLLLGLADVWVLRCGLVVRDLCFSEFRVCVSHSDHVDIARRDVGQLGRFVVSSCARSRKDLLGGQSATDGAFRRRIAAPSP